MSKLAFVLVAQAADPIPLKATNELVLRCGLYASAWDWLALHASLPEAIPTGGNHTDTQFTKELRKSLQTLKHEKRAAQDYISKMFRGMSPEPEIVTEVLSQVESELEFLLSDVGEIFSDIQFLSDIVPNLISDRGVRIFLKPGIATLFQDLHESSDEYWKERSRINPIELNLSEEFQSLDLMVRCGWTIDRLKDCLKPLAERVAAGAEPRRPLEKLVQHLKGIESILTEIKVDTRLLYFFEQFRQFSSNNPSQAYYLSYILEQVDVFRLLRKRPEYVRVKNLFSSPYEEEVEIAWRDGRRESDSLHEALFSLVPGHWTYRFGKNPLKTRAGRVRSSLGGILTVSLDQLTKEVGSQFVQVKRMVPGPPGYKQGFDVIRPTRLEVFQINEKYLRLNHSSSVPW